MTVKFVSVECILVSMAMEYNMQGIWHHTNSELNDVHTIMLVITCTHILQLSHCFIVARSQLIFLCSFTHNYTLEGGKVRMLMVSQANTSSC